MGSSKSSSSESYSGSGQKWAQPYAKRGINMAFNAYDKAQPTLDKAVAGTSGIANQLQTKFGQGLQTADQAQGYWGDVLSGKYLNSNPYLDDVIGAASGDIREAVNGNYAGAGRYGSAYHDKAVANQVGEMASQVRYGDYNNQMGRMDQAAGAAAGANAGDAQMALGAYGQQGNLPYVGSNNLANQLAAYFNGGNSKSTTYAPSPIWGAVGAGLGAAGAYFSDRRLKKNITPLGKRGDGLMTYSWVYKNDPDQQVVTGYMADEVREIYPEAYIENYNGTGYQGVNYALIPHETKLAA